MMVYLRCCSPKTCLKRCPKYASEPQRRFSSRPVPATMKELTPMLRFIAFQNRSSYVVQPLPVSHFQALLGAPGEAVLQWQPVSDPLEPTAEPAGYIVYTRREGGGFDNGTFVEQPRLVVRGIEPIEGLDEARVILPRLERADGEDEGWRDAVRERAGRRRPPAAGAPAWRWTGGRPGDR